MVYNGVCFFVSICSLYSVCMQKQYYLKLEFDLNTDTIISVESFIPRVLNLILFSIRRQEKFVWQNDIILDIKKNQKICLSPYMSLLTLGHLVISSPLINMVKMCPRLNFEKILIHFRLHKNV